MRSTKSTDGRPRRLFSGTDNELEAMTADTTLESTEPILRLKVDKRSPVPMYVQISRRHPRDDRVSRTASRFAASFVKRALQTAGYYAHDFAAGLHHPGTGWPAEPQRGRGTWVRRPRIERTLEDISSFSEYIARKGKTPSSRVLLFEQSEPSPTASSYLEPGTVYRLKRLRFADNIPMVIEEVEILAALCSRTREVRLRS